MSSEGEDRRGWKYTQEHHKQAFELFKKDRQYNLVASTMDVNVRTIRDWSLPDYVCRFGCQWHDWDKLLAISQQAIANRMRATFENPDPLADISTVEFAREVHIEVRQTKLAIAEMIRSDIERLTHLELLYGAVFFKMTGVRLDKGAIYDAQGLVMDFSELYGAIPDVKSLDGGLRSLFMITAEIDKIKVRAGLVKENGQSQSLEAVKEEAEAEEKDTEELDMDDLRKFKRMIQKTPVEKQKLLKAMMEEEDRILHGG